MQVVDLEEQLGVRADHRKTWGLKKGPCCGQIIHGAVGYPTEPLKLRASNLVGLSCTHWQLIEHITQKLPTITETASNPDAATLEVEEPIFRDPAGAGLVLDRSLRLLGVM